MNVGIIIVFYLLMQMEIRLFAKWKAVKVHKCNRVVSSSLALSHCVTDMEATAKFSVDHSENVGVWIDMEMSYQGQRLKEYLTVDQMVSVSFVTLS